MKFKYSDWLWDTGILQFGYFVVDAKTVPVRFCLEYLPAYPQLLSVIAQMTLAQIDLSTVDHLIVAADSVPLGVACALQSELSLVYSRGRSEPAVYDLVGSYNSGHKGALLINGVEDEITIEKFVSNARSVGLEVPSIVSVLELKPYAQLAGIPVRRVFRLADLVKELLNAKRLSEEQTQAVMKWINDND